MICPKCNNGFLSPSLPKALVISYRGFSKQVATEVFQECSSCSYESTDSLNTIVDIDAQMNVFKREINRQLSIGEELCM